MLGENVVSYSTAINIFVAWVVLMFFLHLSFALAINEEENTGRIRRGSRQTSVVPRIVGGTAAPPRAYPFFVQWMRGCGGTLIHDDLVLTAGHCLKDSSALSYDVYIGNHESGVGNTVRSIVDYALHPRFDFDQDKAYDFLILKLNRPVRIGDPNTSLVTLNSDPSFPSQEELLTVIGFGHTHEDSPYTAQYLQQVQVPHVPDCSPFYSPGKIRSSIVLCAGYPQGGRDSCQADSGGPLLATVNHQNSVQVGLVSWGRGCARPNSPGVYARISTAHAWIQHQVCHLSAVPPPHCVHDIRVDILYNLRPRQLEWSLLDATGKEVTVFRRGNILHQSTRISLPAGSYQLYLNDGSGTCCSSGSGVIVISEGSKVIAQHSALFDKELYVPFEAGGSRSEDIDNDSDVLEKSQHKEDEDSDEYARYHPELPIPIYTNPPSATPTTLSPTPLPTTPSPTHKATVLSSSSSSSSLSSSSAVLRIEILYDMHAEETGWFLIDMDANEEIFASTFNEQHQNESNIGKGLQWDVTEWTVTPGHRYWFVVADAARNGMCCRNGRGRIRIKYTEERGEEEDVIWEHDGRFQSFVEAHFDL